MKNWWFNFCDKACDKFNYFFTECKGIYWVFIYALLGIACAVIGHYGKWGFDWKWFLFFELPLYIFCTWALVEAAIMYHKTINKK